MVACGSFGDESRSRAGDGLIHRLYYEKYPIFHELPMKNVSAEAMDDVGSASHVFIGRESAANRWRIQAIPGGKDNEKA